MALRVVSVLMVVVFLLGHVWAKEPNKCCWISQMYGEVEIQEDAELEDGTIVIDETLAEFAYDKTFSAKAFIFRETFENGTEIIARLVEFYDTGVLYYIETDKGVERCLSERISAQFKPHCIPEKSYFVNNVTLGNNTLDGDIFELNVATDKYLFNGTYLTAADYCVPILDNFIMYDFTTSPPVVDLVTASWTNIRLGICDRDKFFKVPRDCPQGAATSFMKKKLKQRRLLEAPYQFNTFM